MRTLNLKAAVCALAIGACTSWATTPVFEHQFKSESDTSGKYAGSLKGTATLETIAGENVLSVGENGYFDFGNGVGTLIAGLSGDYTIVTSLYIPKGTAVTANGNFVFNFGNSSSTGYMFFSAKDTRFSITPTNWSGEQTVGINQNLPKGEWISIAVVEAGNNATIYINGEAKQTATVNMHPSALGKTPQNWLGRSPYDGDVLLKNAKYLDFSIYDTALSAAEVKELASKEALDKLNARVAEDFIDETVGAYKFDFSEVRHDVDLPTDLGGGVTGEWTTSAPEYISASGKVTRPAIGKENARLTLTLTAGDGNASKTYEYAATVIAQLSAENSARYDLDQIELQGNKDNLRNSIALPGLTKEGSTISWKSNKEDYLTSSGKVMKLSPADKEKVEVTLTATAVNNGATATRDFAVKIAKEEDYDTYLFTFFPNNDDENIYYALSTDGFNYQVINGEQKVIDSKEHALKKGMRDPYLTRGEDGMFYMIATDMKCAEGWDSNRGIVMLKSPDLVNWTSATVHFPTRFPEWSGVTRVWAPEMIWDKDRDNGDGTKGRFLVYYSLLTNDGKCEYDKVYYSYANADFTGLETEPEYFYDRGSATIDCDIVYNEADGLYHMVYKNEGSGGICKVTAKSLTPAAGEKPGSQWGEPSGTLQQTSEAVEGAGLFRLTNSDTWVLMYDCYMNGHYQFCTSEDLSTFRLKAQTATQGAFTPRHGSVLALHPEETQRLLEAFPTTLSKADITGAQSPAVRQDRVKIYPTAKSVYLPVMPGTNLSEFDPMLTGSVGTTIEPEGPQDFSDEQTVEYTVTCGDKKATYNVTAKVEANPVLPGFCADPEVLYSHKTGRFYIYPTSDGVAGWGGHTFNVYSSADLQTWHKENCILDLATDDVKWATGNAWAPSIEEKLCADGKYRYYFYFSGHNPEKDYKTLGCAVSESPVGPFKDLGKPMLDKNVTSGQLIDSDVFTDPVSGTSYFYWGNGNLVASKLSDDMTSVSETKVITPAGGSLSTYAFREGVYVFYREGKYYFLWSVDDTGAKNYHVAYGTSDSPMGPIKVAADPIVLIQDAANEIYGTGHNSIVQIPGRDEWYIVYHRINKDFVSNDPGVHREVCIDKMEFNADGTIKRVKPTHTGVKAIEPVSGVKEINAVSTEEWGTPVNTFFYDVNGTFVGSGAPTAHGLYVKVDVYPNGKMRATKEAVK